MRGIGQRLAVWASVVGLVVPGVVGAEDGQKPATLAAVSHAVDWAKLPRPDGAERVHGGVSYLNYWVPASYQAVAAFYRASLPPLGWVERKETIPGMDASQYLYVAFEKEGIRLNVTGYKSQANAPLLVSVMNAGNVDARKLPRVADAKAKVELRTAVIYMTGAKREDVVAFCRKEFTAAGWAETPAAAAAFLAKDGRTVLRFIQNAMECTVIVAPGQGGLEVTLSPQVRQTFDPPEVRTHCAPKETPTPAKEKDYLALLDIRKLPRLEKAEKLARDQQLLVHSAGTAYQVPASVDDVASFYRKVFGERGWVEVMPQNDIEGQQELRFEKEGYLVSAVARKPSQGDKVEVTVTNHGNVDLRQLPYPPGAEVPCRRDVYINCTTTLTKEAAAEFYRKELPKLGWEERGTRGKDVLRFAQHAMDLHIEVGVDTEGRTAVQVHALLRGVE